MSMYWILFIGIAVISYIVQNSLQSKFKKYSKMPLASGMTGKLCRLSWKCRTKNHIV